jgi:hypothetical protein
MKQLNPTHTTKTYFSDTHFNVTLHTLIQFLKFLTAHT